MATTSPLKSRVLLIKNLVEQVDLKLSPLTGETGLSRKITNAETNRPGLALAGFVERFSSNRIQILGETELSYLNSLPSDQRLASLDRLFDLGFPAW